MKARFFPVTCVYPSSRRESIVPLICISGRFLENAGFMTGDEVSVQVVKPGELVVTVLPEIETSEGGIHNSIKPKLYGV